MGYKLIMIPHNEFYFLRHGQTDYNLHKIKIDHPADIPLNDTGRGQALEIEPIIANLPVKAICCSPMRRAVETKEIAAARLAVPHIEIPDLGECTAIVWKEMPPLKEKAFQIGPEPVLVFMQRVLRGMQQALSLDGPVLIIAHGGVHWALCSLMNIQGYDWATDNCVPIHFIFKNGSWTATRIN
jgi:probable phosphoglycerate mutase